VKRLSLVKRFDINTSLLELIIKEVDKHNYTIRERLWLRWKVG
jgi:hypothetical protein